MPKLVTTRQQRIGSTFSGYGGLDLAVERIFDARTAWFMEYEPAPSAILDHRWPGVPNYGDITKVDWRSIEPVEIIAGGSPCQDMSEAGRGAGMVAGTRSGLWEFMRQGIEIIKPDWVVWENVKGSLHAKATSASDQMEHGEGVLAGSGERHLKAVGRVLGDLADDGYDAKWRSIRAADVGAPHGRLRVFILAKRRS